MFTLKIENSRNDTIELTHNESEYQVISVEGLNPPKAQINTSTIVGLDGSRFNSSKLENRNIVIQVRLNGDIETNRNNLYKYFITKESCTVYYSNSIRDVYIKGYVESVEVSPFTDNEIMQISIICPQPYFKDMEEIIADISSTLSAFVFPFSMGSNGATNPQVTSVSATDNAKAFSTVNTTSSRNVNNVSASETGVIVEVDFKGNVSSLLIRNTRNGQTITINHSFIENDKLIINTNKGEKSVKLIRNGVTTNLLSKIARGSTFFVLDPGDNLFNYLADNGDHNEIVFILFRYNTIYRGV